MFVDVLLVCTSAGNNTHKTFSLFTVFIFVSLELILERKKDRDLDIGREYLGCKIVKDKRILGIFTTYFQK